MPYEAAKCPNCGGELQLDNDMETGFCAYCNSKFIVRNAGQKRQDEETELYTLSIENDLLRGRQCLEAHDWQNAFEAFSSAADKDIDNFNAWFGCLMAMTQGFRRVEGDWVSIEGVKGLASIIRNCFDYANEEQKQLVKQNLIGVLQIMTKIKEEDYNDRMKEYLNAKSRKVRNIFITVASISVLILIYSIPGTEGVARGILGFILLLVGFAYFREIIIGKSKPIKVDSRNDKYISLIRSFIE